MNHLPSPEEMADQWEESEEIDEFKELQDFFSSESTILDRLAELNLEDDDEDDWNDVDDLNWSDEFEDDWSLEQELQDFETDDPITEKDLDGLDKIELFDHQDSSFKPKFFSKSKIDSQSNEFKEEFDKNQENQILSSLEIENNNHETKNSFKIKKTSFLTEELPFDEEKTSQLFLHQKIPYEVMLLPVPHLLDPVFLNESLASFIQKLQKPKGKRGRKKGSTQANKELRRKEQGIEPSPFKKRLLPIMPEPSKAAKALWKKPGEITPQDLELAHLLGIRPGEAYLFRHKPQPRIEPERHLEYEDLLPIESDIKVRLEKPNDQSTQNFYRYRHASEVFNSPEVLRQLLVTHGKLSELRGMLKIIKNHDPFLNIMTLVETSYTTKLAGTIVSYDHLLKEINTDTEMPESIEALGVRTAMMHGFERLKKEGNKITLGNWIEMNACIDLGLRGLGKYPWQVRQAIEKISSFEFPSDIVKALKNIEGYINNTTETDPDPLIKLALLHHSIERMHPFQDGNGRTARAIAQLYLVEKHLLPEPIFCMSKYFYETRTKYTELMEKLDNDPTYLAEYLLYYLKGIEETSDYVISMIEQVQDAMHQLEERLENTRMKRMRHAITEFLFSSVYTVLEPFTQSLWVSRGTAFKYLKVLISVGALSYVRYGQFVIYKNRAMLPILGMREDGFTAISKKYQGKNHQKRNQIEQKNLEYSQTQPKRKRGRPRKNPLPSQPTQALPTQQEPISKENRSIRKHNPSEIKTIKTSTPVSSATILALQEEIQKSKTKKEESNSDLFPAQKKSNKG